MTTSKKGMTAMSWIIVGILILVIPFIPIFVCANSQTIVPHASATWDNNYVSLEEMTEHSDLVIIGEVISSEIELRDDVVFTMQQIEILDVITGDLQPGNIIEVLQTGGVYGEYITAAPEEIPILDENSKYVLYLEETAYDELYGQYYLIAGGYQGCALLDGNNIEPITYTESAAPLIIDSTNLTDIYAIAQRGDEES